MSRRNLVDETAVAWKPNSEAQWRFSAAGEFEALYGGAKGGGKSRVLVAMALRFVHRPTYKAVIFRRTYPRLKELIEFARRIYPLHGGKGTAKWMDWRFPGGGQILFRHMQHESDAGDHQGQQYQFIGFDELTQFTKEQYEELLSCARSEDPEIPVMVRSTANPGGIGHGWVKERFIDCCPTVALGPPRKHEETGVVWQPLGPGPVFYDPLTRLSRRFYPSKAFDNPDLLKANPHYINLLKGLPLHLRKAYLEGDWNVFHGQYFTEWKEALHVRPPGFWEKGVTDQFGIPLSWERFGGIDYGSANPWSAVECAADPASGRVIAYRGITAPGWNHQMQAEWLREGSAKTMWVADDGCFWRGNPKDEKVRQASDAELWAKYGFTNVMPAQKGYRVPGWAHLREFLKPMDDAGERAWLEVWDRPGFRGRYGLITVFPKMVHSEDNPEDMESDCPDDARDDALDALRYALLMRPVPKVVRMVHEVLIASGDYYRAKELAAAGTSGGDESLRGTVGGW